MGMVAKQDMNQSSHQWQAGNGQFLRPRETELCAPFLYQWSTYWSNNFDPSQLCHFREAWWFGYPQFSKRRCCHTDMPSIMIFTQVESRFLAWTSMMNLLICLQDSKCAPCITSRPRNSDSVPYPLTSKPSKANGRMTWKWSPAQKRPLVSPVVTSMCRFFFRRCARCALRQEFENDFELDLVGWPRAGCPVGTRPWKTVRMIINDHPSRCRSFGFQTRLLHTFTIL